MKASRAPRPIKDSTFLDDPSLYPEYAGLVAHLPTLHAFRHGFHVHRTSALLLVLAVCMAASGVPVPAVDGSATAKDWLDYAFYAMGIDRLVDHFEGLWSGFAAMGVVALIAVLVYPLHALTTRMTTTTAAAPAGTPFVAYVVAVGLPSAAVWGFAVWAESRYVWALGPGLWFGLFCACVTLKITSFVATASGAAAAAARGGGDAKGGGGAAPAAPAPVPLFLTFGEYLFFVFLSPSLVCEMRLLKVSARRPSRYGRAASEFFHAALTFLCAHCAVGSFVAPSLRLFVTGLRPGWVEGAGAGWAALEAAGGAGWPSWEAGSALLEGGADAGKGLGPLVTVGCFLWLLLPVASMVHFFVFYAFWHCICLGFAELWGFPDRNLYGCWWLIFDEPRDFLRMWSVPVHRWLCSCVHWPMLELTRGTSPPTTSPKTAAAATAGAGTTTTASKGKWVPAVLATCIVSGVFHEAVVYVAMRGTCWPFNTFLLCVAAMLLVTWDVVFPPLRFRPVVDMKSSSSGSSGGGPEVSYQGRKEGGHGGGSGGAPMVRPYGARGNASAFSFTVLIQLSAFIADTAAWLWWRHIHMKA